MFRLLLGIGDIVPVKNLAARTGRNACATQSGSRAAAVQKGCDLYSSTHFHELRDVEPR